ncbi:YncE family protein [Glaciecola sp. KUL10]|uniref:YncE family protein n=1 Tax=Glaciecola sp. (strain KUL10) TaxID=2161813 RepID=UPI000D7852AC|nr:beta-propeller fold lactonase family protein [Glaciecola sp. KUL10]GBL05822.1 40-residue YVTN family beta-propeller repeat protein [Glaciecola sp. KUL10]
MNKKLVKLCLAFILFSLTSQTLADPNQLSGTLAVVNKSDNTISLIDLSSSTIINTLPTGTGPHELIVSRNGKWAVSTDFVGGNSLTVFNLAKQKIERTIQLNEFPGPHGIKFLPVEMGQAENLVAFTSGRSQHLVIADIFSGEIISPIPTKQNTTHMLAIDSATNRAYTTNIRSNTISQLDLTTQKKEKDITTKAMPEAINIAESKKQLWYGANKGGLVTVLDLSSKKELAEFKDFKFPYRVLFNHDESIALVPDFQNHDLRLFSTDSLTEIAKIELPKGAGPQGITLHPEKDIVFLSLNLLNKVLVIDIQKQKIINEFPTGKNPDGVGFSSLLLTSN